AARAAPTSAAAGWLILSCRKSDSVAAQSPNDEIPNDERNPNDETLMPKIGCMYPFAAQAGAFSSFALCHSFVIGCFVIRISFVMGVLSFVIPVNRSLRIMQPPVFDDKLGRG